MRARTSYRAVWTNQHARSSVRRSAASGLLLAIVALASCVGRERNHNDAYVVTARLPHDSTAYTQGLLWSDSVLFESTGEYGHSDIRRVDLKSGRVLAPSDSINYPGEGWGLATDGTWLIMSDGSDSLRIMSPDFRVHRIVHVKYNGSPLRNLNELEFVNGEVLANVYQTDWLLRIDPSTGNVRETIDFGDLYPSRPPFAEVMNGVAVAPDGSQLLLTGKHWPVMFEVRLQPPQTSH